MKGLSTEQNVHKSMNIVHNLATLALVCVIWNNNYEYGPFRIGNWLLGNGSEGEWLRGALPLRDQQLWLCGLSSWF